MSLSSGSFFESVPSGADAYVLKSVIHNWNDERARVILQRCSQAMAGRGKIIVGGTDTYPSSCNPPRLTGQSR